VAGPNSRCHAGPNWFAGQTVSSFEVTKAEKRDHSLGSAIFKARSLATVSNSELAMKASLSAGERLARKIK
jgi:hypothetical protein